MSHPLFPRTLPNYYAIEGLDGAGKSTIRMALEARLRRGLGDACSYHDPNRHLPVGALIYKLRIDGAALSDELCHALFAAGSIEAQEEALRQTSKRLCPIIADRGAFSNYAALALITPERFFQSYEGFAFPRISFFLDVPLDLAMARVTRRDGADSEARWLAQNYTPVRARFVEILGMAQERGLQVVTIPVSLSATPDDIAGEIEAHIRAA